MRTLDDLDKKNKPKHTQIQTNKYNDNRTTCGTTEMLKIFFLVKKLGFSKQLVNPGQLFKIIFTF
jgi:hypothetical protein